MLIVICGATATGKSGLALTLASRLNSSIISADSRQIYREFNIGTAKPTLTQQNLVRHYLIDICDPTETLTLAEYQEYAQSLINTDFVNPLLVGGTGLYIKSIVQGLKIPRVSPQAELRSQLESLPQKERYAFLSQIDAIAAAKIHPHDQVRTIRALEVYYVTGIPISQQQGQNPPSYPILQIGLDSQAETLKKRIEQRTMVMIKEGFVEEVENLCKKYGRDLPLLDTLGYREIKQYLIGEISLSEAQELTILHTRQFAKRQRTWFKADTTIEWFDADCSDLLTNVSARIEQFLGDNYNLKK